MKNLNASQIQQFIYDGFVKVDNAFPAELAEACRKILWDTIQCDPNDPESWTQPVIRIGELTEEPFIEAANTPLLHTAFNQLTGKDNWLPRHSLGSFPIRFPSRQAPMDTGWHVDASFPGADPGDYFKWHINFRSKGRALLMLFIFSEVGEKDAPTLIKVGSHWDIAHILEPFGEAGLSFMELSNRLGPALEHDEIAATGSPGTVYLCHPFIVHAAQPHQGTNPKFMAQPPLLTKKDFNLQRADNDYCPVELAIRLALEALRDE